jgi:dihydroorotate dehydrogenase (NAD+) catalytic subunit
LETEFLGVKLKNPVIAASGTFGFGREYNEYYDVGQLGGICSKGLTLYPKDGNSGIRIWETPAGLMNSIGLQNPGVNAFIRDELPFMQSLGCAVIANLGGSTEEEYVTATELLNDVAIDILELNISCPNVAHGGMAFGIRARDVYDITKKVKQITVHPLMVKLSPNAENICDAAGAAEDAGADAVSLINTIQGMAIDVKTKRAVFDNGYAGLSGSAIKPIALRMVHQVCKRVAIPVCGIGGIVTAEDALEFIMAGASVIQIGSGLFRDMQAPLKIIDGLECYCENNNLSNLSEIRNIV